jgi:thioredoxin-like negative regulator of GroEL
MPVKIVNDREFSKIIAETPVLLAYFYNDQCAPCLALRPKVAEMIQEKFPKTVLIFINALDNPGISAQYGIFSSPTLLVFFEGKETIRESKYIGVSELEKKIGRYYNLVIQDNSVE